MKYKCPSCGCVFENELEQCPNCSQVFNYGARSKSQEDAPPPASNGGVEVMMPASSKSGNSAASGAFNFFWFVFYGLWAVIANALQGAALCLTIIGIPAGIVCFKFIPVVARPSGREVLLNFKSHPFLNVFQFIFGGFLSYTLCLLLSALFFATIIGIPLGRQLFKIARFFLAPFGSRMVYMNQYTDGRDTIFDVCYFLTQVYFDDREALLSDGRRVKASEAMKATLSEGEKEAMRRKLKGSNDLASLMQRSDGLYKPSFGLAKYGCFEMFWIQLVYLFSGWLLVVAVGDLINRFLIPALTHGSQPSWSLFEAFFLSSPWFTLIFALIFLSFAFMAALDVRSVRRGAFAVYPAYLSHWKAIAFYYPNKVDPKQMNGRKNKNLDKGDEVALSKYQLMRTIDDMILSILIS